MAFSVLRNFGIKVFYGIPNSPEVLSQSLKPTLFQNLPILSNNLDSTSQVTSVRWRTKVPKKKKIGQFPPDLFKVITFSKITYKTLFSFFFLISYFTSLEI